MLAIHTEQLTRTFKGKRAVDGLNLDVEEGAIFCLLGAAGAGKTTTLRLLLGLLEPTHGRAVVLGHDIGQEADAVRANTGALLAATGLHLHLSAAHNLDLYGRMWRMESDMRCARIRTLLRRYGLWERRDETLTLWSRADRQRLALVRALLPQPSLLLLDEPATGLTSSEAEQLRADLARIAAEGVTLVITGEQFCLPEPLCNQVGILHQGKLIAAGRPSVLQQNGPGARLEIIGCGFTEAIVELVARRREVCRVAQQDGRLWVDLCANAHGAPVVNLVVESGADVEEVRRHPMSIAAIYHALQEKQS
jgi:ABC-2 type transport system ATP-binding protein